jgi:hypothetical protein
MTHPRTHTAHARTVGRRLPASVKVVDEQVLHCAIRNGKDRVVPFELAGAGVEGRVELEELQCTGGEVCGGRGKVRIGSQHTLDTARRA